MFLAVLLFLLAPVLLFVLLTPTPAHAQAKGAACPVNGYTAAATQATGGQNLVCSSLTWNYVPYQFGASAGTCPGASNVNLGMLQWTGSAFQGCTASGWGSLASGATTALSALTSATAAHSFDNTSFAQTWTWNSLTTQTAMTLSSSSLTNGSILSIQNTAASATSTGQVLSISDATTGSGYGVYSSMTGHGNTGYAGYFTNTDTSTNANYGVYASILSSNNNSAAVYGSYAGGSGSGEGVWGTINSTTDGASGVFGTATGGGSGRTYGTYGTTNSTGGLAAGAIGINNAGSGTGAGVWGSTNTTGAGYGVYGTITGHGNTGYAGYFLNTDTSSNQNYGIMGTVNSTNGNSAGIIGVADPNANTGSGSGVEGITYSSSTGATGLWGVAAETSGTTYGVYATNATTGAGYGVYGTITGHGNTGYAGYFINTDTGADANYGVYGTAASSSGYGGYFTNTSTGWALNATGTSYFNGSVGIGTTSPTELVDIVGSSKTITSGDAIIFIRSSDTQAADKGGSLTFGGQDGATSNRTFATIAGFKENSTSGNYNGYLAFATRANGSTPAEAMRITSAGSVGIGTTNPLYALQVLGSSGSAAAGAMSFAIGTPAGAASSGGLGLGYYASNYNWIQSWTSLPLYINPLGNNTILNSGGGSVGIGTTTPAGQLDVEDTTAGNTGYAGYFNNTATTNNYGVYGTTASTGAGFGVYGTITGHGNTGYAGYFINTDTSTNQNYGVAGIISSTTTATSVGVYGKGDCAACYGVYGTSANNQGVDAYGGTFGVLASSPFIGVDATSTNTGTGYGVYGTITGHGNTGYAGYFINTDTSSNVNFGIYAITLSTGNSDGIKGECDGSNCAGVNGTSTNNIGVYGYGGYSGIYGQAAASTSNGVTGVQLVTPNTGYAGYFTNTDTASVSYGLYASTSSATGWAGYFNGNVYVNGTITMSSDRRMKKDIEPLDTEDALDEITALRPVTFTWKKTGVADMGLIAQEVDPVFPELVTHGGADETLALKYTSLIAPMIASIQELKKRNDELEIETATLRRDFNAYKEAHP